MKKFFKSLFSKDTWSEFWFDADETVLKWVIGVIVMALFVAIAYKATR